jgi:hypothetical protein
MSNTKRIDDIVNKLKDILDGSKETFTPKIAAVYYGGQDLIPTYPSIAVEGGRKLRELVATRTFNVSLQATIYIYHGKVQESTITNEEVDVLSEQVEDLLHGNLTMDGLVIFGYVRRIDPGVALRSDVMLRTTRMIWQADSRERF